MKTTLVVLIFLAFNVLSFSQSVNSLKVEICELICDCVGDVYKITDIGSKYDSCFDEVMNGMIEAGTWEELSILNNDDSLKALLSGFIPYFITHCEPVKNLIESKKVKSYKVSSVYINKKSFPTNFSQRDLNKPDKWGKKIIAFDGDIIRIEKSRRITPYYEMRLGEKTIWIFSPIVSGFENIGNKVRVLGYLFPIKYNEYECVYHDHDYHVVLLGILDLKSETLLYIGGSAPQMIKWANGQIPSSE